MAGAAAQKCIIGLTAARDLGGGGQNLQTTNGSSGSDASVIGIRAIRVAWIFLTTVYVLNLSKQGVKSLPSWFALMQGCLVGWLLPD